MRLAHRRRAIFWGLFAGYCAGAVYAAAQSLPSSVDLESLGWKHLEFAAKNANRFVGHGDGVIEVISDDSVSALYYSVDADMRDARCLAWSWRVDEAMPANDLRHRGTDDRPLSVYIAYPFDAARASFWENLTRVFVELRHGSDAPGRAIAYTWGGLGNQGEVQPSPYMRSAGAIILLRPGDWKTGQWFEEMVDLRADYETVFDDPAVAPMQIALLADSDDTDSTVRAFVRDLRFVGDCPGRPKS